MCSAACDDATWMSLTETAWVPPPPMLGVSSSTMRGGAVGPSSSCVHHVAGGAGKEEDGRRMRKEGSGAVRRRGVEERIGDQRRVICVMLRLIFGSVVDCRDAWHQLLRCAARSVVNTGSKDRNGLRRAGQTCTSLVGSAATALSGTCFLFSRSMPSENAAANVVFLQGSSGKSSLSSSFHCDEGVDSCGVHRGARQIHKCNGADGARTGYKDGVHQMWPGG